ncbi:hypothetical protein [Methylobacterium sp. 1030]|uniref:hypothetical protein n=1 Tax=Methylobacterium sp. 1030 TaxID=3156404 RepID=UPI00339287A7
MVANGSSAPRATGIARGVPTGRGSGRPVDRGRRRTVVGRPGPRARPVPVVRPAVAAPDAEDMRGYEETDDGIDPAFDECSDIAGHIDGLAARVRRGLCRWDDDDPWTEAD